MTVSTNIKCDVCGHTFTIKSQMDDSIFAYDWPIEIVCPECSNHIALHMNYPDGIKPSSYIVKEDGKTHIGYSATLPILSEIYYKEGIGSFNPFYSAYMNLCGLYGIAVIEKHKITIAKIINGIIPYKSLMIELLPFVKLDGNPEYLLNKLAVYFKQKRGEKRVTANCLEIYNDFIETIFNALSTAEYIKQRSSYMLELRNFVDDASTEQLQQLLDCASPFQDIDKWLISSAYPYIADIVNHIEQYLPATFFSSIGAFSIPHAENLNILTIDNRQVSDDYARGFEELMKIVPFMAAIHNLKHNGDCNHYKEGEVEYTNALEKFVNKTNGDKKKEIYNSYPSLKEYLEYTIENHIRNGKNHEDEVYDVKTQNIAYHFNANRADAIHNERLIDVSFRVYLQLVVMMEITILINYIKKKL